MSIDRYHLKRIEQQLADLSEYMTETIREVEASSDEYPAKCGTLKGSLRSARDYRLRPILLELEAFKRTLKLDERAHEQKLADLEARYPPGGEYMDQVVEGVAQDLKLEPEA